AVAANAAFLNPTLRDGKALAVTTDHIRCRYSRVLEQNLPRRVAHHRRPQSFQSHAGGLHIDNKTRNTTTGTLLWIGYCDDLSVIRGFRPRYESFGAVDHIMIAIFDGARLHPRRIAAGIGFGLGEANPLLPTDHGQEKPHFLFFVAVKQHRSYFGPKDRCVAKRGCYRPRDLFHDHAAAHEIEACAAVFRRNIEQPKTDS